MIPLSTTTERLDIRILDVSAAKMVLDFYQNNANDFEKWDPPHGADFYSLGFHENILRTENKLLCEGKGVRYYLFERGCDDEIAGSVSFAYMHPNSGRVCSLGYKLAVRHRHKGYAYEALSTLIPMIQKAAKLGKLEADILGSNSSSIKLIKKLGFEEDPIPILLKTATSGYEVPHKRFFYYFSR